MNAIIDFRQPHRVTLAPRLFEVTDAWDCSWLYRDQTRQLSVPDGYRWDGASIPRSAWSIIGLTPSGEMDGPSLAHDSLYRSKGGRKVDALHNCKITNENGNAVFISRSEADWLIAATMKCAKVKPRKRIAVYVIVRIGGGIHWGGPMPYRNA